MNDTLPTSNDGSQSMFRRLFITGVCVVAFCAANQADDAAAQQQQRAYGANWGQQSASVNYDKFYHYPYVTYPQNYWNNQYYRSADSLYYRYPAEMRIPVYNRHWHNYYPSSRRYHWGHHFLTDIF